MMDHDHDHQVEHHNTTITTTATTNNYQYTRRNKDIDMNEDMTTDGEADFEPQSATSDRGTLAEALRRAGLYDACLNTSSSSRNADQQGDG